MDLAHDEKIYNRPQPEQEIDLQVVPIYEVLKTREEGCPRSRGIAHKHLGYHKEQRLVEKKLTEVPCTIPGAPKSTFLMVFSPDGRHTASTHGDHNIYITETNTGKWVQTLKGHPRTPWCIAYHPSTPDLLASGCLGGEVRVWDKSGCCELWTQPSKTQIASVAFHPADNVLAIATNNQIHLWNWQLSSPFVTISTSDKNEKVKYIKFDHMGFRIITGISNPPPSNKLFSDPPTFIHRSDSRESRAARVARLLTFPTLRREASISPPAPTPRANVDLINSASYRSSGTDDSSSSTTSSSSTSSSILGTPMDIDPPLTMNFRRDASTETNGFDLEERTGEGNVMRDSYVARRRLLTQRLFEERQARYQAEIQRRRSARMQARNPSRYTPRSFWHPNLPNNPRSESRYHSRNESRYGGGNRNLRRRKNEGGRWMYFSERDRPGQSTSRAQSSSTEATPGTSTSASEEASTRTDNSSSSSGLNRLDPSYGVQLLSRHTENMQRICRSLATPRSSSTSIRAHRSEIPHLQLIRTMLFDIQRQIHSLRASVDQTMEELPDYAPPISFSSIRSSNSIQQRFQRIREFEASISNLNTVSERIGSLERANDAFSIHLSGSSSSRSGINPEPGHPLAELYSPAFHGDIPSSSYGPSGADLEGLRRLEIPNPRASARDDGWFNDDTIERPRLSRPGLFRRNPTGTVPNISTMDDVGRNLEEMAEDYWRDRLVELFPSDPSSRVSRLTTPLQNPPTDPEPEEQRRPRPPTTSLSQRLVEFFNERYPSNREDPTGERSRSPFDGRVAPCRRRNILAPSREFSARQNRIEHYRGVLQEMAGRLQTLMDQQSRTDESLADAVSEQGVSQASTSRSDRLQRIIPPMENLRFLVQQALHLIYQLIHFICHQNGNNEERPISRMRNPFRADRTEQEFSMDTTERRIDSSVVEPSLSGLNALLDAVRVASDELREETESSARQTPFSRREESEQRERNLFLPDFARQRSPDPQPSRPAPEEDIFSGILSHAPWREDGSDHEENRPYDPRSPDLQPVGDDSDDDFLLRSQSGIPMRLLGRQNAVDERSEATDEDEERGAILSNPLRAHPRQASRTADRYPHAYGARSSTAAANRQRLIERRARVDQFIYHRPSARIIQENNLVYPQASSQTTFRLQCWEFDVTDLPDLTDRVNGLVVPSCKIHFDASISISDDSTLVAALVPGTRERLVVAVYSLVKSTLGDPLCTVAVNPNAICVSLSPTLRHLVIGIASPHARWNLYHAEKEVIASIYLVNGPEIEPLEMNDVRDINQGSKPQFKRNLFLVRNLEMGSEVRNISLNSIKWLPHPGQGFIYGTNRGQLSILC